LVTDRRGIPLAVRLIGANVHDSTMLGEMLDAIPPITGKSGRPRRRPDKCHADKGDDYPRCRNDCRTRGIAPRIAPGALRVKKSSAGIDGWSNEALPGSIASDA
jgi:hypothetical protein